MPVPKQRPQRDRPQYSALVPAVEQAARILLCLAGTRASPMTLTEISQNVGIHKSKAYSILNTLQNFNFVQRDPRSKSYSLGTGLLFLSNKVLSTLDLREAVHPQLESLARETESTAFFGLISHGNVFVVAKVEGGRDFGLTIRLGHRFPLPWGAHGKAIAAFLTDKERKDLLAQEKLYFHGRPSDFDRHRLKQELARCREIGFCTDWGEMQRGVHAVAAPVFGPRGGVIGSIVVVGTFRKRDAQRFGLAVATAAQRFSESIGGLALTRDRGPHHENESTFESSRSG